jgi:hypothetical protein
MEDKLELPWSRYPAGCEFKAKLRNTGAFVAMFAAPEEDENEGEDVLILGRGKPETYVLTSPPEGTDKRCWASLNLANTLPKRDSIEAFVRQFGLPYREISESQFLAARTLVQLALFCMNRGGWAEFAKNFQKARAYGGRGREPRNLFEFVFRELEHLDDTVALCEWEECGDWYVQSKHTKKQRFCSQKCKMKWDKAANKGTPRLSVALGCIKRGNGQDLERAKGILSAYIKTNGGPTEFAKQLAACKLMVVTPKGLVRTLRSNKEDLQRLAHCLYLLEHELEADNNSTD